MKKIIVLLFIIISTFSLCGCLDVKPAEWDITKDTSWENYLEGVIRTITTIPNPNADIDVPAFEIVFEHGQTVIVGGVKDPGSIKPGDYGILYKRNLQNDDYESWFQWITILPNIEKENQYTTTNIVPTIQDNSSNQKWIERASSNPKKYTPVLIKFINHTYSVGYINDINEWKLSINQFKENGGEIIPNTDIIAWKNIDIE
jgi:hypothetical protein